ncbi:ornithine cyclodeaminase family protein [Modestobacter versicolor]|uniref:ornithine cyclodeaminase family protein n=1 Tax=Modestobacter versicolor TaxID=429133 RepID=UPI0034DEDC94
MRILDAAAVTGAIGWTDAVEALRRALLEGLDPETELPRTGRPFGAGELLVMPSDAGGGTLAAVKLATVTPDVPGSGLPRVNAVCVLFDAVTLAPVAVLDGVALTALRTPAVSALAVDLVAPAAADRLLVFGTGPQAAGHVAALRAVRPLGSVGVVGRVPERTAAFVDRLRADGVDAAVATAADVADADVVACCTTARRPLFDGRLLSGTAVVVACGSHEKDAREVDSETVRRCGVVVESVTAACREAGDVVLARAEGAVTAADLVPLARLVRGESATRPRLVKTVGMGWEDLVVAAAVFAAVDR